MRPFTVRNGFRLYEITEDEYRNPGELLDSLINEDICTARGFIVRCYLVSDNIQRKAHYDVLCYVMTSMQFYHFFISSGTAVNMDCGGQ